MMIVKSQDGKEYDIYTIATKDKCVYCQDNSDRRMKRLLGVYSSIAKATEVFDAIRKCVVGYYEMPQDSEV